MVVGRRSAEHRAVGGSPCRGQLLGRAGVVLASGGGSVDSRSGASRDLVLPNHREEQVVEAVGN